MQRRRGRKGWTHLLWTEVWDEVEREEDGRRSMGWERGRRVGREFERRVDYRGDGGLGGGGGHLVERENLLSGGRWSWLGRKLSSFEIQEKLADGATSTISSNANLRTFSSLSFFATWKPLQDRVRCSPMLRRKRRIELLVLAVGRSRSVDSSSSVDLLNTPSPPANPTLLKLTSFAGSISVLYV